MVRVGVRGESLQEVPRPLPLGADLPFSLSSVLAQTPAGASPVGPVMVWVWGHVHLVHTHSLRPCAVSGAVLGVEDTAVLPGDECGRPPPG